LVEETRVPEENHRPVASHCQTLSHNVVLSTPRHEKGFKLATLVVIGTYYKGSLCLLMYIHITFITVATNRKIQNQVEESDVVAWKPKIK